MKPIEYHHVPLVLGQRFAPVSFHVPKGQRKTLVGQVVGFNRPDDRAGRKDWFGRRTRARYSQMCGRCLCCRRLSFGFGDSLEFETVQVEFALRKSFKSFVGCQKSSPYVVLTDLQQDKGGNS